MPHLARNVTMGKRHPCANERCERGVNGKRTVLSGDNPKQKWCHRNCYRVVFYKLYGRQGVEPSVRQALDSNGWEEGSEDGGGGGAEEEEEEEEEEKEEEEEEEEEEDQQERVNGPPGIQWRPGMRGRPPVKAQMAWLAKHPPTPAKTPRKRGRPPMSEKERAKKAAAKVTLEKELKQEEKERLQKEKEKEKKEKEKEKKEKEKEEKERKYHGPKRGRGRPRKYPRVEETAIGSETSASEAPQASETSEEAMKPAKEAVANATATEEEAMACQEPAKKRKRGRTQASPDPSPVMSAEEEMAGATASGDAAMGQATTSGDEAMEQATTTGDGVMEQAMTAVEEIMQQASVTGNKVTTLARKAVAIGTSAEEEATVIQEPAKKRARLDTAQTAKGNRQEAAKGQAEALLEQIGAGSKRMNKETKKGTTALKLEKENQPLSDRQETTTTTLNPFSPIKGTVVASPGTIMSPPVPSASLRHAAPLDQEYMALGGATPTRGPKSQGAGEQFATPHVSRIGAMAREEARRTDPRTGKEEKDEKEEEAEQADSPRPANRDVQLPNAALAVSEQLEAQVRAKIQELLWGMRDQPQVQGKQVRTALKQWFGDLAEQRRAWIKSLIKSEFEKLQAGVA
eukprot:g22577.t1